MHCGPVGWILLVNCFIDCVTSDGLGVVRMHTIGPLLLEITQFEAIHAE